MVTHSSFQISSLFLTQLSENFHRIYSIFSDGYEDGEMIIKCGNCKRWCHAECDSITNEEDAEKCAQEGYTCQLCRPADVVPAHLAKPVKPETSSSYTTNTLSEYSSYSHYNSASFIGEFCSKVKVSCNFDHIWKFP